MLFRSERILYIFNVSHSDEGLYTCIARTPLDEDTAAARITVLGRNSLFIHPGSTFTIACPVCTARNHTVASESILNVGDISDTYMCLSEIVVRIVLLKDNTAFL